MIKCLGRSPKRPYICVISVIILIIVMKLFRDWIYKPASFHYNIRSYKQMKLSFILMTRNDNYRGTTMERLATTLREVCTGMERNGLSDVSEVVITDWNSKSPVYQIDWLQPVYYHHPSCKIYWVKVSPEIAAKQAESPLSEVHALNVAARFAHGEMILRIDQDTLVGPAFFHWLKIQRQQGWPEINKVWWSGRRDTERFDYEKIVKDPYRFLEQYGKAIPYWFDNWFPYRATKDYFGAAIGVFAIPKDAWMCSGGYNEGMIYFAYVEWGFFCRLHKYGVPFINTNYWGVSVHSPFYHIWHPRNDNKRFNPRFMSYKNERNWGLLDENLPVVGCYGGTCNDIGTWDKVGSRFIPYKLNGYSCFHNKTHVFKGAPECNKEKLPFVNRFIVI
ncbi:unnamed protein product [Owenia fusiformis]|uniref:Uncharacterized protein n=1 Tax=Owenia fusiformis TaxID=6347 RepID=A0A8J1UD28_OWEFU|nr:unnamed protein product [Owenia fusiformis]